MRIGIAGPLLGVNEGWVVSQGEILARNLESAGVEVVTTSPVPQKIGRAVDTVRTVYGWTALEAVIVMVFSGQGFAVAELTDAVAHLKGLPVILHLHGGDLPKFAARHPVRVRRLFARARAIVAPSRYLAATLEQFGGPISVIPNVLEADLPSRTRTSLRPNVLWMRTFEALYQPELAVEVAGIVRRSCPDLRVTMAGQDRGELKAVRRMVSDRGLEGTVELTGFLDSEGKSRAFDGNDIFLNTTRIDNTPVSLLEAAHAGLPIVTTSPGGIPYLFEDGKTALLAGVSDAAGLSDSILRLLEQPATAERLSRAGQELARRSRWPAVWSAWQAVIDGSKSP